MAQFLTTTDTSAAIERVIRNAEKELTLISAYVYPRVIYLHRLKDAAERGVHITFVFGKKRMDDKVFRLFAEVPNLSIYYLHELHAKCFVNEHEAIVTSLNLLNGSEEKNREMGVRLDRTTDAEAYRECVNEVKSILSTATLVHQTGKVKSSSSDTPAGKPVVANKRPMGFCIRTGVEIPFDPTRPFSYEAYKVWAQYYDEFYPEKFCHFSGEISDGKTSMQYPILKKHLKEARRYMEKLDPS
jgi:phosphatidylserine/phosphatidylglycerophosphate/cardiolipin synthase-like enzyme